MKRSFTAGLVVAVVVCLAAARGAAAQAPATQPAGSQPASQPKPLPHMTVDRANRVIDLDAKVILREGKWIELLACTPGTRDHEAILTIPARPSHIHLALLMIGLQPGTPLKWTRNGDNVVVSKPTGAPVAVSIVLRKDGKEIETPANEWVMNQKTHKNLEDNIWLFAGSSMVEFDGQQVYQSDASGTVISLVNFGDDLLTRPSTMTNNDDDSTWGVDSRHIPEVGTAVKVRLRPAPAAPGAKAPASETKPAPAPRRNDTSK